VGTSILLFHAGAALPQHHAAGSCSSTHAQLRVARRSSRVVRLPQPHGTLQHLTPPTAGVGWRALVCMRGPMPREPARIARHLADSQTFSG
jgi:hypothetical protein